MKKQSVKKLTTQQQDKILAVLRIRFEKHESRHNAIEWEKVERALKAQPEKLITLAEMERTGGEPDVIGFDKNANKFIFCDCAKESPVGRRSLCYDRAALNARKENKPSGNVVDLAEEMGVELLSEQQYRDLQQVETVDTRTSSWLKTPDDIRKLGGAIFGDFRYGRVFVYHNGAESYYSGRGFRGVVYV